MILSIIDASAVDDLDVSPEVDDRATGWWEKASKPECGTELPRVSQHAELAKSAAQQDTLKQPSRRWEKGDNEWFAPWEAQAALRQLLGAWEDRKASTYELTADACGQTISVVTRRRNGERKCSHGLIRLAPTTADLQQVVWGAGPSFTLDRNVLCDTSVTWNAVGKDANKAFYWTRASVALSSSLDWRDGTVWSSSWRDGTSNKDTDWAKSDDKWISEQSWCRDDPQAWAKQDKAIVLGESPATDTWLDSAASRHHAEPKDEPRWQPWADVVRTADTIGVVCTNEESDSSSIISDTLLEELGEALTT